MAFARTFSHIIILICLLLSNNLVLANQIKAREGFAPRSIVHTNIQPKKIEDIKVGDLVRSQNLENNLQVVCPVIHIIKEIIPSYVEIVLEDETITTAPGQKFYLENLEWVTAQDLIQSPELQAHFPEAILEIRQVNESIEVYRLTVAHEHNFYVTKKLLLVHNMNPEVIFRTFAVGATFFTVYVIPAAQSLAPIVGPAIGGWVATHIIKGFRGKQKEATQSASPGGPGDPNWPPKKNGNNNKKPDSDDKKKDEKDKKDNDGNKKDTSEKNKEEQHPNGVYEEAPYHHQYSRGQKSPAPKNGQKALDDSIPADKKGNSSRRVSVNEDEIVVFNRHAPGKYHGHVRGYRDLDDDSKAALHKHGKVNLQGKILK